MKLADLLKPDWDDLVRRAAERASPMKGRKMTDEHKRKCSEAHKAIAKRRRDLVARACLRCDPPAFSTQRSWHKIRHKGLENRERLIVYMTPGSWYAVSDMAYTAGLEPKACKILVVQMMDDGWLERVQNPEHVPDAPQRDNPKWIYRLTPAGEIRQGLARLLQ
jgi:hypothetical protein